MPNISNNQTSSEPQYSVGVMEDRAVMLAFDATAFHSRRTRLFFLLPDKRIKPYVTAALSDRRFILPHLADIFDDPEKLANAVHREYNNRPNLIIVIRLFTFSEKSVAWDKPLVLNANVRVVIVGDRTGNRNGSFLAYLNDKSKFGNQTLSSCKHNNLVMSNVGFYATNGDIAERMAAAGLGGSTSIIVNAGSALAPWFSQGVIGSWGVKAIVGATGVTIGGAAAAAYLGYKVGSIWWSKSGQKNSSNQSIPLTLEDAQADEDGGFNAEVNSTPSPDQNTSNDQPDHQENENNGDEEMQEKQRKKLTYSSSSSSSSSSSPPPSYHSDVLSLAENPEIALAISNDRSVRVSSLPRQLFNQNAQNEEPRSLESFPIDQNRVRQSFPTQEDLDRLRRICPQSRLSRLQILFQTPLIPSLSNDMEEEVHDHTYEFLGLRFTS